MSIVMICDTDSGNRCFVYSEKNIYTVNMTQSQYSVFIFRTSPLTVHTYMYLIATERSHKHTVTGAVLCFQPLTAMT
jgi:hypothetical protein